MDVIHDPAARAELNLLREGISTIAWGTGYRLDHRWIDVPIFDALGYPQNVRGVTAVPGLYFLGLLWQHSQASASLVAPEIDGPWRTRCRSRRWRATPRSRSASPTSTSSPTSRARARAPSA